MITQVTIERIWAKRRQQSSAMAKAAKKRELPRVDLSDAEWRLLRASSRLEAEWRAEDEKRNRK